MDRLQTEFENAWRACSQAVEKIFLLLLTIVIVFFQGILKLLLALYQGIDHSSTWLVPGKYTWQLKRQVTHEEPEVPPVRVETVISLK
jgi:hypothetical protein